MNQKYEKVIARFNDDVIAKTEENLKHEKVIDPNLIERFNLMMNGDIWKKFVQNEERTISPAVYKNYDFNEAQKVNDAVTNAIAKEAQKATSLTTRQSDPLPDDDIVLADEDFMKELGMFDEPKDDTEEGALDILKQIRELDK